MILQPVRTWQSSLSESILRHPVWLCLPARDTALSIHAMSLVTGYGMSQDLYLQIRPCSKAKRIGLSFRHVYSALIKARAPRMQNGLKDNVDTLAL